MKKSELYKAVIEAVESTGTKHKVSAEAISEIKTSLTDILAPKRNVGEAFPDKVDGTGKTVESYCKLHRKYYPIAKMVIGGNGKSKNICLAAEFKQRNIYAELRKVKESALSALKNNKMEEAIKFGAETEKLQNSATLPETYDAVKDWEVFDKHTASAKEAEKEKADTSAKK